MLFTKKKDVLMFLVRGLYCKGISVTNLGISVRTKDSKFSLGSESVKCYKVGYKAYDCKEREFKCFNCQCMGHIGPMIVPQRGRGRRSRKTWLKMLA